jgi:hypothetical protein
MTLFLVTSQVRCWACGMYTYMVSMHFDCCDFNTWPIYAGDQFLGLCAFFPNQHLTSTRKKVSSTLKKTAAMEIAKYDTA